MGLAVAGTSPRATLGWNLLPGVLHHASGGLVSNKALLFLYIQPSGAPVQPRNCLGLWIRLRVSCQLGDAQGRGKCRHGFSEPGSKDFPLAPPES